MLPGNNQLCFLSNGFFFHQLRQNEAISFQTHRVLETKYEMGVNKKEE